MITYLLVAEVMGRGECDREFEAGQHQKPKIQGFSYRINNPLKKKLNIPFPFLPLVVH